MKTSVVVAVAACAIGMALRLRAADAAAAPASAAAASPPASGTTIENEVGRAGEPNVKRTVIDDSRARIEELRVRGQLQKVTVAPKGGAPGYEILLGDGAHPIGDDPGTSRGSAGKRVWNVLVSEPPDGGLHRGHVRRSGRAGRQRRPRRVAVRSRRAPAASRTPTTSPTRAQGRFVLTLFERLRADELPFYLQLMKHHRRPRAAGAAAARRPERLARARARRQARRHRRPPSRRASPRSRRRRLRARRRGARAPARRRRATSRRRQPNLRGLAWWSETVPVVVPHLDGEQAALMQDELAYQRHLAASSAYATLPRAAIHGDLFRDNVMFVERTPRRRLRLLLRRRRHPALRHRRGAQRLVHRPRLGPPRRGPCHRLRRRLRVAAPARDRRGAPAAGADARGGVPLLAVARLGPAPAARRRRPQGARPRRTSSASSSQRREAPWHPAASRRGRSS